MSELTNPYLVSGLSDSFASNDNRLLPILQEIRQALTRLAIHNEEHHIDLSVLDLSEGDIEQLRTLLGHGEVEACIDSLGLTQVEETAIPGVWLIDYRYSDDQRLALHIQITSIPAILRTPVHDLADSLMMFDTRINSAFKAQSSPASDSSSQDHPSSP